MISYCSVRTHKLCMTLRIYEVDVKLVKVGQSKYACAEVTVDMEDELTYLLDHCVDLNMGCVMSQHVFGDGIMKEVQARAMDARIAFLREEMEHQVPVLLLQMIGFTRLLATISENTGLSSRLAS